MNQKQKASLAKQNQKDFKHSPFARYMGVEVDGGTMMLQTKEHHVGSNKTISTSVIDFVLRAAGHAVFENSVMGESFTSKHIGKAKLGDRLIGKAIVSLSEGNLYHLQSEVRVNGAVIATALFTRLIRPTTDQS